MNKDEILKKSRRENKDGDERYRQLKAQTDSIILNVITVLGFLFCIFEQLIYNDSIFFDYFYWLHTLIRFLQHLLLAIRCRRNNDIVFSFLYGFLFAGITALAIWEYLP